MQYGSAAIDTVGKTGAQLGTGWPLLLIAALIGILINYFKGKEVDEWLERCFFGLKEAKERFPTLAEDQKAFTAMLS
ncbi:hypothetical protein [Burkholderia orbicola]|uniref:hypothetical protein n=1 Tax=Burkholderia orbicola TaxID=2978683 RepID=UPI003AF4E1FE